MPLLISGLYSALIFESGVLFAEKYVIIRSLCYSINLSFNSLMILGVIQRFDISLALFI